MTDHAVTVRRADGTTTTQPAYTAAQIARVIRGGRPGPREGGCKTCGAAVEPGARICSATCGKRLWARSWAADLADEH